MPDRKQLIDGERVHCAVKGEDVDIERCFACPRLRDIRHDGDRPIIVCRIPPTRETIPAI